MEEGESRQTDSVTLNLQMSKAVFAFKKKKAHPLPLGSSVYCSYLTSSFSLLAAWLGRHLHHPRAMACSLCTLCPSEPLHLDPCVIPAS